MAASDTVLALGMVGGMLLSVNADLGTYFYLPRAYVDGSSTDLSDRSTYSGGDTSYLYTAVTSTQLSCTLPRNVSYPLIECFLPDLTQNLPSDQSAWQALPPVPIPQQSSCNALAPPPAASVNPITIAQSAVCFGIAASIWAQALVLTGAASGGGRFFATYYVAPASGGAGSALNCTFGCGADTGAASAEPTFGDAVALWDDVLVVGVPGAAGGRGGAALFRAAGPADGDYDAHRRWRPAGSLGADAWPGVAAGAAVGRIGAALSLGPTLLVAAAPGNAQVKGAVAVFAYGRDGAAGNVTLRPLCSVARTTRAAASAFGLGLAQSAAGPGWTVVAVGSPDESRLYMLWVSDAGACEVCAAGGVLQRGRRRGGLARRPCVPRPPKVPAAYAGACCASGA